MFTIVLNDEDHMYSGIYKKWGTVKKLVGTVKSLTRNIPPLPVGAVVKRINSKLENGNVEYYNETVKHIGHGNFVPVNIINA